MSASLADSALQIAFQSAPMFILSLSLSLGLAVPQRLCRMPCTKRQTLLGSITSRCLPLQRWRDLWVQRMMRADQGSESTGNGQQYHRPDSDSGSAHELRCPCGDYLLSHVDVIADEVWLFVCCLCRRMQWCVLCGDTWFHHRVCMLCELYDVGKVSDGSKVCAVP